MLQSVQIARFSSHAEAAHLGQSGIGRIALVPIAISLADASSEYLAGLGGPVLELEYCTLRLFCSGFLLQLLIPKKCTLFFPGFTPKQGMCLGSLGLPRCAKTPRADKRVLLRNPSADEVAKRWAVRSSFGVATQGL